MLSVTKELPPPSPSVAVYLSEVLKYTKTATVFVLPIFLKQKEKKTFFASLNQRVYLKKTTMTYLKGIHNSCRINL